MPKLTDEELDEISVRAEQGSVLRSQDDAIQADGDRDRLLDHIDQLEAEKATLIQQVANLTTELEDTRAAYQLTRHQLDTHRRGQGAFVNVELCGDEHVIGDQ